MNRKLIIFLLSIVILLTGCRSVSTGVELALCGSYAVPGMYCYELKGDGYDVKILEEDKYDRILYEYTTQSVITRQEQTVLLICQKIDSSYVYFYEDMCYLLPGYTVEQVEGLKEKNNWDQPLNIEKCSRRNKRISFDMFIISESEIWHSDMMEILSKGLSVDESKIKDFCFLDEDYSGNVLYWACISENEREVQYFVIVNHNFNIAVMEIYNDTLDKNELSDFKKNNNWSYGDYQQ